MARKNQRQKPTPKQKPKKEVRHMPKWLMPLLSLVGILLLTYFAMEPSLRCEFTNWDDGTYVTENYLIRGDLSKEHIKEIWETPVSLNYHPLTMLSLAWDYQKAELDAKQYHQTNLIFHLLKDLAVQVQSVLKMLF